MIETESGMHKFILPLTLLIAFACRTWGVSYGLPYSYISDEAFLINHALALGTGDLNPHFFEWPGSLLMYSLLFLYGIYYVLGFVIGLFPSTEDFALSFIRNPTNFYMIARLFTVFASTVTVYLAYRVGAKAYDKNTGLLTALFLSVSPLVSGVAHFTLTDTFLVMMCTAAFIPLTNVLTSGDLKDYILSGFLIGLGASIKYNAVFLFAAFFVAHMLNIFQRKVKVADIVLHPGLWIGRFSLIFGFIVGCPYCVLDFSTFYSDVFLPNF